MQFAVLDLDSHATHTNLFCWDDPGTSKFQQSLLLTMKNILSSTTMCFFYSTLVLFLVLSSVEVHAKLGGEQQQRNLITEPFPCVPFDNPQVQAAIISGPDNPWGLYSPECDTNSCSGGCCRAYTHVLTCDTDDDYPHMQVRETLAMLSGF